MANFNARIREFEKTTGKTNIKIRISHKGKTRYIRTDYDIEPRLFDNNSGRVKPTHPLAADINIELAALELQYNRKALKLEARIKHIDINDLIAYLSQSDKSGNLDFYSVAETEQKRMEAAGQESSSRLLKRTAELVKAYQGTKSLPFVNINPTWLRGFESWYNLTGSQNGAAINLRNIRSIYNIAINDHGLSAEYYPFRKFKIKTVATIHRDLSLQEIALLLHYQPATENERITLDLWFLSFYLCGANFKDLLTQTRESIKRDRFVYNRAKTGTIYSIKMEPEALEIISRYKGTKYMLRFLEHKQAVQVKEKRNSPLYKDITDRANRTLKTITKRINKEKTLLPVEVSTYYARHSWASIASSLGISQDIIREALGHSRSVTDVYINFYTAKIDQANRSIIDALKTIRNPDNFIL